MAYSLHKSLLNCEYLIVCCLTKRQFNSRVCLFAWMRAYKFVRVCVRLFAYEYSLVRESSLWVRVYAWYEHVCACVRVHACTHACLRACACGVFACMHDYHIAVSIKTLAPFEGVQVCNYPLSVMPKPPPVEAVVAAQSSITCLPSLTINPMQYGTPQLLHENVSMIEWITKWNTREGKLDDMYVLVYVWLWFCPSCSVKYISGVNKEIKYAWMLYDTCLIMFLIMHAEIFIVMSERQLTSNPIQYEIACVRVMSLSGLDD